uniref:FAM13A-like domain-containing protein n=1 Tax=Astatotilapia calliptera TaxID=8154 RepID=A0AAX7V8A0_ASTCA
MFDTSATCGSQLGPEVLEGRSSGESVILVILTVRQLQASRHSPSFKHFLLNPLKTIETGSRLSFGIRTLVGVMMTVDSTEEQRSDGALQLLTFLTRPPQSPRHPPLTAIHPGQQPPTPDVVTPPSPHHSPYSPQRSSPGGEGGHGSDGGGALLQLLAGGASPLPSPRCSSPCQRFNSDPDSAPSPPCSQQYILCRGDRTQDSEGERPSSVPFLTRHIQTLKKKVRRFEDQFEQEMNYKPSHNDKYSNPEMIRVMGELAKARKQLKGDGRRLGSGSASVVGAGCSHGTKQEKNLVKPLYDRYQMIKHLLCASPTISTIEEEDGSDEDCVSSLAVDELPVPPPRRPAQPAAGEEDSDRDSDPAFVSPLDEVKAVRQQDALTTANLHEASRSQLLDCLRETRAEKKARRKVLKEFEDEFYRQTGRICQKEDRTPMKEEYQEYKQLKAKLRLLEVLLSKQEVAM